MSETASTEDILEISASASAKIKELIDGRERAGLAVRVILRGRLPGGKFQTEFKFVDLDDLSETDLVQDTGLFKLYNSDNYFPAGVKQARDWTDPLAIAVQEVIDTHINPGVSAHGGWVLLLDVKDDHAHVEMGGGCQGCGAAAMTLRQGIETSIMEMVPGIKGIVDVTDHGEGENPYYAADAAGATPFGSPPTSTAD